MRYRRSAMAISLRSGQSSPPGNRASSEGAATPRRQHETSELPHADSHEIFPASLYQPYLEALGSGCREEARRGRDKCSPLANTLQSVLASRGAVRHADAAAAKQNYVPLFL